MLKKRVITSILGLPLLIAAVWFNEPLPWFTIFVAIWGLMALYEFYRLVGVTRLISFTAFGFIWTVLFISSPHFTFDYIIPVLLAAAIVLSLIMLVLQSGKEHTFLSWAWMMTGILYVGWLLSFLVALRMDAGRNWVFLALVATFASDTAAFFVGRALGRHSLASSISPHKTWEGAVGGVLGAVVISLLFTLPTPLQLPLNYVQAVVLGLLVSVFGQFGDLAESLLKRSVGVKESGRFVPGHGGFLDRMDSVVFAGVVVYLYFVFAMLR
jgi:phosphatidate cytidylyltransferase